jgi:NAD(P)-dependent dehydrogenase (short-subunit alcohol dehydrogenase family)
MKIDLKGKTALVTGSTAGIGLAIAKGLAAAGARIIVNGRKQGTVDKAVIAVHDSVNAAAVSGIAADVSTPEGCEAIVNAIPSVDILINNAGIFEPKPFFDIPDADWTRFFQTNVMSGVRLSRAYLPGMLKQNWGRIVFISSESALNIPAEMIHYGFHENRAARRLSRARRADGRGQRHGQFGAARTDAVGRRRGLPQGHGKRRRNDARRNGRRVRQGASAVLTHSAFCQR